MLVNCGVRSLKLFNLKSNQSNKIFNCISCNGKVLCCGVLLIYLILYIKIIYKDLNGVFHFISCMLENDASGGVNALKGCCAVK